MGGFGIKMAIQKGGVEFSPMNLVRACTRSSGGEDHEPVECGLILDDVEPY